MAKYKNIVGTPFLDYVQEQINIRVKTVNNLNRSTSDLQYLSNRNSWIRLSSGAMVNPNPNPPKLNTFQTNPLNNSLDPINERFPDFGDDKSGFSDNLSKNNILQGGTISSTNATPTIKKGFSETYTQGTDDRLGLKPMPGITNISVGTGGKWQTLMEATVEFICYDLDQLDLMSKLYMSLGVTVFLEWGHTPYLDNNGQLQTNIRPLDFFNPSFNKKETLLKEVTKKREISNGNYDGMLGTVYNFGWTSNNDGSYNCKTQIMGPGGMIESLKINTSTNIDFDAISDDEINEKYRSTLENALVAIKNYLKTNSGEPVIKDSTIAKRILQPFNKTTINSLTKNEVKKTYGDFLNTIYSSATYKGPTFRNQLKGSTYNIPGSIKYSDTNSEFGNAWQIVSGISDSNENIKKLESEFYAGYVGLFTSVDDVSDINPTYITFGHFLCLVQHLCIFTEGDGDTTNSTNYKPSVYIDYNPENTIISKGKLEASIDPTICLIPWNVADSVVDGQPRKTLKPFFHPLDVASISGYSWLSSSDKQGNILKNFLAYPEKNAVNNIMGSGKGFEGKLFNVLVNIDFILGKLKNLSTPDGSIVLIDLMDGILDGINSSLGNSNNFRTFSDPLYPVIRIIDENYIETPTEKELITIPNFGLKSIVYDYGFTSQITPKLASQIVIATQGLQNGGIKNFPDDVLSYQKLNQNVRDRFSNTKQPSVVPSTSSNSQSEARYLKNLQILYNHIYNVYSNDAGKSLSTTTISNLTNLYSDLQNKQKKLENLKGSANILIPIEFNITLDGISGILPYNAFKIEDNRLPKQYKGRVAFAVFSINHNFDNNQWTTQLRGSTLMLDNSGIKDNKKSNTSPEVPLKQPQNKISIEQQTIYPGVTNPSFFDNINQPTPNKSSPTPSDSLNESPSSNSPQPPNPSSQTSEITAIMNFLKEEEGFRPTPYFDVTKLRIGYGSDTITRTNGSIEEVIAGKVVNITEAELDLKRRIEKEFKPKVVSRCKELGVDYIQLPLKVKVIFLSLAYNYGTLFYDFIRSYINNGVQGLINELNRRASLGPGQVPIRRAKEIKYLQNN